MYNYVCLLSDLLVGNLGTPCDMPLPSGFVFLNIVLLFPHWMLSMDSTFKQQEKVLYFLFTFTFTFSHTVQRVPPEQQGK